MKTRRFRSGRIEKSSEFFGVNVRVSNIESTFHSVVHLRKWPHLPRNFCECRFDTLIIHCEDYQRTDLEYCESSGFFFDACCSREVHLENSTLSSTRMAGCFYQHSLIRVSAIVDTISIECQFFDTEFSESALTDSKTEKTYFLTGRVNSSRIESTTFKNATFDNLVFRDSLIKSVEFASCEFIECIFIECRFESVSFENCIFVGQCLFYGCTGFGESTEALVRFISSTHPLIRTLNSFLVDSQHSYNSDSSKIGAPDNL